MPFFERTFAKWPPGPNRPYELIFRIPNQIYPDVKKIHGVIVNELERAVLIQSGSIQNVLPHGRHQLPKDVDEVIWVDTSQKPQRYGIPNYQGPVTADNLQIGFSGTVTLRVDAEHIPHVKNFLREIVAERSSFTSKDLIKWLREGLLISIFGDIISGFTYEQFMRMRREDIINRHVIPELEPELRTRGLSLVSMSITGITRPKKG